MVLQIIVLNSCTVVGTVYPLSEKDDEFLYKKELTGEWVYRKDSSAYFTIDTVAGTSGNLYRISVISRGTENAFDTTWFQAHLAGISGEQFLDCWMDVNSLIPRAEEDYSDLLVKKHFFFRIRFLQTDSIEIVAPDPDELIKLINQQKIRLHYIKLGQNDYLILNKPVELQKALTETKKYPKLYKDKMILVRL